MKLRALLLLAVAAAFGPAACGPTVGDPCTTAQDCLGRTCLNGNGAPGGYCSVSCALNDASTCPTGTLCIRDGIDQNQHGCFRICSSDRDCRPSYRCATVRDSASTVCTAR